MPATRPVRPAAGDALAVGQVDDQPTNRNFTTIVASLNAARQRLSDVEEGARWLGRKLFSSSSTYTPAAGTTLVLVRMVGGGGGGGGGVAGNAVGGGGGSGVYLELRVSSATGITGGPVTIGAAGAAGANTGGTGGTGGDTSLVLNGTTYTARGGTGGAGSPNSAGAQAPLPGAPQTGSSLADVTAGTAGMHGRWTPSDGAFYGGNGGSSPFGGGGRPVNGASAGDSGTGKGSGGGGAAANNSGVGQTGGAGMPGVVIIDEYTE